jgi:serine/threonine protein kinase
VTAPLVTTGEVEPGRKLLGRFTILRELGRGGVSVVYAARDETVGADVAVKVLVPPPASAREAKERMRREVNAVRGLRHPNIVGVHDFLEDGPTAFIVMDVIDGVDLAAGFRGRGPLPIDAAVALGRDIADALATAHRAGIIHRDIKPANILLDRNGKAFLTDFGSARLDAQTTMTRTGGWVGTLAYLAPEVWLGGRPDARADVYALGTSLFEAVTGRLPRQTSPHLPPTPEGDGFHPGRDRAGMPTWLDQVIATATTADPRYRFATAGALRDALDRKAPVQPVRIGLPTEPPAPGGLPFPFKLLLVTIAVVGIWGARVVSPWLLVTSAAVIWLLHRSARRSLATSPDSRGDDPLARPTWTDLPRAAAERLAAIPAGPARTLVEDVLTLARSHLDHAASRTLAARRRDELAPIVSSAIDAGHELAQVDDALARLERDRVGVREVPPAWWDGLGALERARDGLSSVLLELVGTLGRARGAEVDDFDAARRRLEDQVGEYREAVVRQVSALAELDSGR